MNHCQNARLVSALSALGMLCFAVRAEAIITVTPVTWLGNAAWKIEGAANGTFYFESGETDGQTGFSSAIDQEGNDWINNDGSTANVGGGRREYRGFPNLGNDDFNHPQRNSGSQTAWLNGELSGESLVMESSNDNFRVQYHFFATHITIQVLEAGEPYSFLFEGPIGGSQEVSDWMVSEVGGVARPVPTGPNNFLDPQFYPDHKHGRYFYLGDDAVEQVFFVAKTPLTADEDEGWRQGTNMVISSFGRGREGRTLTGTENTCTFGFLDRSLEQDGITAFIEATLANPLQPVGGDTSMLGTGGSSPDAGASVAGSGGSGVIGPIMGNDPAGDATSAGGGSPGAAGTSAPTPIASTPGVGGAPSDALPSPVASADDSGGGCHVGGRLASPRASAGSLGALLLALATVRLRRRRSPVAGRNVVDMDS